MFFGRRWALSATLIFGFALTSQGTAVPPVCSRLLASPTSASPSQTNEIDEYFKGQWEQGVRTVFLFAIGGGNDTFSSLIPTVFLKESGFSVHAFGVLSTTAHHAESHDQIGHPEKPIFEVGPAFERVLLTRPPKAIRNTERVYSQMADRLPQRADSMHLLSAKFPPKTMTEALESFIDSALAKEGRTRREALVVMADFGADVLSRGEGTTISPDLDAAVLRWTIHLPSDLQKIAWLIWPGVDGELSPRALRETLAKLSPHIKASAKLTKSPDWMGSFERAYDEIVAPIRTGNTIRLAFDQLNAGPFRAGESPRLRKSVAVGKEKILKDYAIELDRELVQTTFLVDAAKLYEHNPFAQLDYRDGLDFFLRIQKIYREANLLQNGDGVYATQNGSDYLLQYLLRDSHGLWSSRYPNSDEVLHIAVTPESISAEETKLLLLEALELVALRKTDVALFSLNQLGKAGLLSGANSPFSNSAISTRRSRHYLVAGHGAAGALVDDLFHRLSELGE